MNLVVRTDSDPAGMISTVRDQARTMEEDILILGASSMADRVAETLKPQRFNTALLVVFAALALTLAAVGIYGVISYGVAQRTREIGIRMALGASRGDVVRMVLGQGLLLSLAGTAIGLAGAFALTRLMANLLYEVSATDPVTFAATSLLLVGVAGMASLVPARRAIRVDPMVALRYE